MGWVTAKPSSISDSDVQEPSDGSASLSSARFIAIGALLLFASAINYMDRQTLANVGTRITREFNLREQQYGNLEASFGLSFAVGSLMFGFLADKVPLRFLYPTVLFLWSATGFLTGYVNGYHSLLACRGMLGFFEAGHWPCGLKAVQILLDPRRRAMGNSVLQSGTSIGAFLTPQVLGLLLTEQEGSWRLGFQIVGAIGIVWIVAWFLVVRSTDFQKKKEIVSDTSTSWEVCIREILTVRMLAVVIVLTLINACWQTLRAWLPKVMLQEYKYEEAFTLNFVSCWYLVTDVGCLGAGFLAVWLAHRGMSIKKSRSITFLICSLLTATLMLVPFLTQGPWLLVVFLLAGAGTLGLFPMFYSFSQDVSKDHQGKVTGITSALGWTLSSPTQSMFGYLKDQTHSYSTGLMIAGALPLIALVFLVSLWPNRNRGAMPMGRVGEFDKVRCRSRFRSS
jgi:MFS transporter, ACS family, hexuronate transporter